MASWPYSTPRWKRLRLGILREEPLCRECRRAGRIIEASQVDHIKAIRDGGQPWDPNNLQPLCATCHTNKTNAEDGGAFNPRRDRSVDPATGRPLAVDHWWNQKISESFAPGTGVGIVAHTKREIEGA